MVLNALMDLNLDSQPTVSVKLRMPGVIFLLVAILRQLEYFSLGLKFLFLCQCFQS